MLKRRKNQLTAQESMELDMPKKIRIVVAVRRIVACTKLAACSSSNRASKTSGIGQRNDDSFRFFESSASENSLITPLKRLKKMCINKIYLYAAPCANHLFLVRLALDFTGRTWSVRGS
jgi:hypothetical protein